MRKNNNIFNMAVLAFSVYFVISSGKMLIETPFSQWELVQFITAVLVVLFALMIVFYSWRVWQGYKDKQQQKEEQAQKEREAAEAEEQSRAVTDALQGEDEYDLSYLDAIEDEIEAEARAKDEAGA